MSLRFPDFDAYSAHVLESFVAPNGRLREIPARHKKRLVVLGWLVEDFQPGRRYDESEVNRILGRRHPDFATLRRRLVDEEFMQRASGVYWRTGSTANVGHDPASWPLTAQRSEDESDGRRKERDATTPD